MCPKWSPTPGSPNLDTVGILGSLCGVILCTVGCLGFPGGLDGKESACNAGDLGLVPRLGKSSGERNGHLLQYSCLGNLMDKGTWQATAHGVTKSWTLI